MVALQAVQHPTPGITFDASGNKAPVYPIRVPRDAIEAYRKTNPMFALFLVETGRVIIEENVSCETAGAQKNANIHIAKG
jgi:hypothetical protein